MIQTLGLNLTLCGGSGGGSGAFNPQIAVLMASAIIPTRDGVLTTISSATVDPITGATVPANTPNGRTLNVGTFSFPGAALLAQRATNGLHGALTSAGGLASLTTAAGAYPIVRTLIENSANSPHAASSGLAALTDGVNYATSIRYKPNGTSARNIALYVADGSDTNRVFITVDRNTLAITNNTAGTASIVRSSARLLPDGYIFCQLTYTATAWGGTCYTRAYVANGVFTSYLGDGVSGIDTTAIQTELGEYATTPLAWDGGAGLSRTSTSYFWAQSLGLTAGTIMSFPMGYGWSDPTSGPAAGRIYDANSNGGMQHNAAAQTFSAYRVDSLAAPNLATTAVNPALAGQQRTVTQRWDATSNRITIGGVTVSSAATTPPFAAGTPIFIGDLTALSAAYDGWVPIILWPTALSDSDIALISAYTSIV